MDDQQQWLDFPYFECDLGPLRDVVRAAGVVAVPPATITLTAAGEGAIDVLGQGGDRSFVDRIAAHEAEGTLTLDYAGLTELLAEIDDDTLVVTLYHRRGATATFEVGGESLSVDVYDADGRSAPLGGRPR